MQVVLEIRIEMRHHLQTPGNKYPLIVLLADVANEKMPAYNDF